MHTTPQILFKMCGRVSDLKFQLMIVQPQNPCFKFFSDFLSSSEIWKADKSDPRGTLNQTFKQANLTPKFWVSTGFDLRPITLSLPSNQKSKVTWVPPPQNLSNPLNIVDIARYTEVRIYFPFIFSSHGLTLWHSRLSRSEHLTYLNTHISLQNLVGFI